ncbi:MAG TPA: hypothetical protein DCQ98_17370 [Planctomycetaceae bacterium]|nr:hypothetical protein [Planctomycetaceae bacterium]
MPIHAAVPDPEAFDKRRRAVRTDQGPLKSQDTDSFGRSRGPATWNLPLEPLGQGEAREGAGRGERGAGDDSRLAAR